MVLADGFFGLVISFAVCSTVGSFIPRAGFFIFTRDSFVRIRTEDSAPT
jgi:hypothetical protein